MHPISEEYSKPQLFSSESKLEITEIKAEPWDKTHAHQNKDNTVLRQFVQDLIEAGKSEEEMTRDLEAYYYMLVQNCDSEILDLREQLEIEKAGFREEAAEEVYLKANEIEDLSNIFIDCIHSHRKSLRHKLLKIKTKDPRPQAFLD